jgi:hypothetical protein
MQLHLAHTADCSNAALLQSARVTAVLTSEQPQCWTGDDGARQSHPVSRLVDAEVRPFGCRLWHQSLQISLDSRA